MPKDRDQDPEEASDKDQNKDQDSVSFYSDFAEYYEEIFPYREAVFAFLSSHLAGGDLRVLDIGCGSGHYCGHLATAGHHVVGIDSDPQMVAVAERTYDLPDFHVLDMCDIHTLAPSIQAPPFQMAFCIGNVAAHLPREEVEVFLERLAAILAPDGGWICQVVNWDTILTQTHYRFPEKVVGAHNAVGAQKAVFRREYRDITPERVRFVTQLERLGRTIFTGEITLYPMRAEEYLVLHEKMGFELMGHYADYKRQPFDPAHAPANIMVFRRRG